MLYFIAWVVFLVFAVLAVPIASMLDKKKNAYHPGAMDDAYDDGEEMTGDPYAEGAEVQEAVVDDGFGGDAADGGFGDGGFADAGIPDDGSFPAPSDDDFAAFE